MSAVIQAVVWVAVYMALAAAPLLVLLLGPIPPGAGFWWDFSMAVGFAGMALLGLQFALTARFRRAAAPFGIDILYYFHRFAALIALALVAAHAGILRVVYPAALGSLNPFSAMPHMTAGRVSFLLFAVVVAASLWRKPLRIEYYRWRVSHAVLATVALFAAVWHIRGVGYYIATPGREWLWTSYALFWVALLAYVRVTRPWILSRRPWRVVDVRAERGRSWTISLEPVGHRGFRFSPGQFAWVTLRASPFAGSEHPFSIASSAAQAPRIEFTIKELGDFTATLGSVRPGETAYVDAPYGSFTIDRHPRATGFVFVAGGVGIAPIVSMLRSAADRNDQRPFTLLYGSSRWDDVILREELDALRTRLRLNLVHVIAEPPADGDGERGLITRELMEKHCPRDVSGMEAFVCGPKPMTDIAERGLRALGIPSRRIHVELFDMV